MTCMNVCMNDVCTHDMHNAKIYFTFSSFNSSILSNILLLLYLLWLHVQMHIACTF